MSRGVVCVHENASCVILLAYLLLISWWCAIESQSFYNINNVLASYTDEFLLLKAGHNTVSDNRNSLKISSYFPFTDNLWNIMQLQKNGLLMQIITFLACFCYILIFNICRILLIKCFCILLIKVKLKENIQLPFCNEF